jgi:hypothetical protein
MTGDVKGPFGPQGGSTGVSPVPEKTPPKSDALSSVAQGALAAAKQPVPSPSTGGHEVVGRTKERLGSHLTENIHQLRQKRAEIAASVASSAILGAPVPAQNEELRTIDHLIRIRGGLMALRDGTIKKKSPEEIAEILHSVVVIGAESEEPSLQMQIETLAFSSAVTVLPPEEKAAVFKALFAQGRRYSPEETNFLQELIQKPSFLGVFVDVALQEASKKTPPPDMLPALRKFASLCRSLQGEKMRQLSEWAETATQVALESASTAANVQGSVSVPTEELKQRRQALLQDIGRGGRFLRSVRLLGEIGLQGAQEAAAQVLESLYRVVADVDSRVLSQDEKMAIQKEIKVLNDDSTFQAILEANPSLKEEYNTCRNILTQRLSPPAAPSPAGPGGALEAAVAGFQAASGTFGTEIGKIARFLGHIGILRRLAPQRAQQACDVVVTRLERAVTVLPQEGSTEEEVAALGANTKRLSAQIQTLKSDPYFLRIVHSNAARAARFAELDAQVTELRQALAFVEKLEKAVSLSEKATVVMDIQRFAPKSLRVRGLKKALIDHYSPEAARAEILEAVRNPSDALDELESLYYQLGAILESGLFTDASMQEPEFSRLERENSERLYATLQGAVANLPPVPDFERAPKEFLEGLCTRAGGLSARIDKLKKEPRFQTYLTLPQENADQFGAMEKKLAERTTLYQELLALKKIEGRLANPNLSLSEQARICRDLLDTEPQTEAGKGARGAIYLAHKEYRDPNNIVKKVQERVAESVSFTGNPGMGGFRALFDEIRKIESMDLPLNDDQKGALRADKERVCEKYVQASVRDLQQNARMGLMPNTTCGRRIGGQIQELTTDPDFKRVLRSRALAGTYQGYQGVVRERAAQSKTPETIIKTTHRFLTELEHGRAATIQDFASIASDLIALGDELPEALRGAYEELKPEFFGRMDQFIDRLGKILQGADKLQMEIGLCRDLMRMRHDLRSRDISSERAINDLIEKITALDTTVPAERLEETRRALCALQPEFGGPTTCLTIDQNRQIEIAKQRLTVLAVPDPVPSPLDPGKALELAFAVSFLTKSGGEATLQPRLGHIRGAAQKTLEDQLAGADVTPEEKVSIVRVLSWDPTATMSDVAVLVRNKDRLPEGIQKAFPQKSVEVQEFKTNREEAILEFVNGVTVGPQEQLTVEDFTELERFFESLNKAPLVDALILSGGGGPSNFRLKQQAAERTIWQHRPEDLTGVGEVGPWYGRQAAAATADQGAVARLPGHHDVQVIEGLQSAPQVPKLPEAFRNIDSTKPVDIDPKQGELPTAVMSSGIVPPDLMRHLLRDQVDMAIGQKAAPGSGDGRVPAWLITNMESIAGVFFTEFGVGEARASVFHQNAVAMYPDGKARKVIVARNLHPDTEAKLSNTSPEGTVPVFLALAALGDEQITGCAVPEDFRVLTAEERLNWAEKDRKAYDNQLLRHYVYHLYPGGTRPAAKNIPANKILSLDSANSLMEGLIKNNASSDQIRAAMGDTYIQVGGRLVSLHIYFMAAIHQVRHRLAMGGAVGLHTCPLMPPSIFALKSGDPKFHNRLDCLAYQYIGPAQFKNLAVLAPNTHGDEGILALYKKVFRGKKGTTVRPLSDIYDEKGTLQESKIVGALIQPTNTDALGNNYENELRGRDATAGGSLEAVVGNKMRAGFGPADRGRMEHSYYV